MAYYDALIAEWAALTGSTAQKLAAINALTVSGSIPTSVFITGDQLFNCLVYSEFAALSAAQQTQLLEVCAMPGQLLGGSASPFIAPFFGTLLAAGKGPLTLANLVALAKASVQPWWQANGYASPIAPSDLAAAGGLS